MRALLLLMIAMTGCANEARTAEPPAPQKKAPLFYRNPMNPADTSPVPRKDSMGMDYTPVYSDDTPSTVTGMATVTLDAERQKQLGVATTAVRLAELGATLRTTGRVAFDETRIVKIQPRFDGFIETLDASFTGKRVRRGETLATIYSPQLYATEEEFLLALRSAPALAQSGLPDAAAAARARLHLYGIDDSTLDAIAKRGKPIRALPITAPISGFVTQKSVVAGAKVGPNDALFDLADLTHVWVIADVYEYELPRVKLGQRATITLSYWPDRTWSGRISYVFPTVDPKTRTVQVRIEVDNAKLELKPEMFADVVLASAPKRALVIPEDALIDTGTRKIVFVSLGEGRLSPREITTGERATGLVEVRSGLQAGEQVATGASFLLDSESRLKALPR